jgi:hypothetical protein
MACLRSSKISEPLQKETITLNEEYNVDPPYANCYRYDDLFLVPNG